MTLAQVIAATLLFAAAGASHVPPPDTTLPAWHPGPRGDLAFITSPFLTQTAYRKPDSAADQYLPDGAYGPVNQVWDQTHSGLWLIEEQRYGSDAIFAGLGAHRQDLIERGEKILDWGFARERPDGSFDCPDRFHSMSFFVEVAAHTALDLEASDMAAQNQRWVDSIQPKLALAVHWMMDPANEKPGRAKDDPYTHRFYLDADAIGETGVLLHDPDMVSRSRQYIRAGIARQDPTGFNPEKGGHDTSYHAVGLLFALDYYTLVANDDMRAQLRPMLANGMAWLRGRTRPDGTVDQSGNTRTGAQLGARQEHGPQGNLKTMSYGSAYRASFYYAMVMGDPSYANLAAQLYHGQDVENRQRKAAAVQ